MIRRTLATLGLSATLCLAVSAASLADDFTLMSPAIEPGGSLPADLKCTRDGGDGLSPPLEWSGAPEGTADYAVIMHHYPRDTVEGVDPPSHYWLLWNIPTEVTALSRGNVESIGNMGADKDETGHTGYTPPCSPGDAVHEYTITVYALSEAPASLGTEDDPSVDWVTMTTAIEDNILASASISFTN